MFRTTVVIAWSLLCLCSHCCVAEAQVAENGDRVEKAVPTGAPEPRKSEHMDGLPVPTDNIGFVLLSGASLPKTARNAATCLVLVNCNAILRNGIVDDESPVWSAIREALKDEKLTTLHVRVYVDSVRDVPFDSISRSIKQQLSKLSVFVVMIDQKVSNVDEPWRNRVNRSGTDEAAAGSGYGPPTTNNSDVRWNPFFGPRQYFKSQPDRHRQARSGPDGGIGCLLTNGAGNAWQLVEGRSIAIRYRKGATTIFGFDKETGSWYEQRLPAGLAIEPEVSEAIAFARVGSKVFAFGHPGFDWAELDTKSQTAPIIVFGNGSLVVTSDDKQWIYTSASGKWSAAPPLPESTEPDPATSSNGLEGGTLSSGGPQPGRRITFQEETRQLKEELRELRETQGATNENARVQAILKRTERLRATHGPEKQIGPNPN